MLLHLFLAVLGLHYRVGLFCSCGKWGPPSGCSGFSPCGAQTLKTHGLPWFQRPALESRLQGCGAQAQWFHGVWDLPRPRIEPASPAQAGGFFFTPEPREKPSFQLLIVQTVHVLTAGGNLKDLRLLIRFLLSCRDGGVDQQPARPTATAGSSSLCRNTGNFL